MRDLGDIRRISLEHIDSTVLNSATGYKSSGLSFSDLGDIHGVQSDALLSYVNEAKYCLIVEANSNIHGVFCTEEITKEFHSTIQPIICDDPTYQFFTLMDHIAKTHIVDSPPIIDSKIVDGYNIFIAPRGVAIGRNALIEPNVVIMPGVVIGDNVVIWAGAVIGVDGFQHQHTTRGIISPRHNGGLIIGDHVEIGASASISIGFSYRNTVIRAGAKLDAHVYAAHGADIGAESIICADVKVMGHAQIGARCWVGPNAVVTSRTCIGKEAKISIGSVVTQNVPAGGHVTGNFAVAHDKWLEFIKSIR